MPPTLPPPANLPLTRQRCWNHAEREAAARCPSCARFFCRECVTEHAGRVVCAACLRELLARETRRPVGRRRFRGALSALGRAGQLGTGVLLAWFFFHLLGQQLLSLPAQFHDGTLWKKSFFGGSGDAGDDE